MEVVNQVYKAYINKYGCPKVTINLDNGEKVIILRESPYLVADVKDNKEVLRKLMRHPFLALTKDINAVEVLGYIMNPKNFPSVYKMIHPNSDTANMNKYKPEDDEIIIANLRKKGYDIKRLSEFNDQIMEVDTAKKVLLKHGYTISRAEDAAPDVVVTELGPVEIKTDIVNKLANKGTVETDKTYAKVFEYETNKLKAMSKAELNKLAKDFGINSFGKKTDALIAMIVHKIVSTTKEEGLDVNELDKILDTVTKKS